MKGERDENYESENNQSSQLIAVGRGGAARGSGNRNDSHRRLEQATVVGAIFRQGADSVIDAGGDMAASNKTVLVQRFGGQCLTFNGPAPGLAFRGGPGILFSFQQTG